MHGNVEIIANGRRHVAHNLVTDAGLARIANALVGVNAMSTGQEIWHAPGNDVTASGAARLGTTADPFEPTLSSAPDTYWQLNLTLTEDLTLGSRIHLLSPGTTTPLFSVNRSDFTPALQASYSSGFRFQIRWRLAVTFNNGSNIMFVFPNQGSATVAQLLTQARMDAANVVAGHRVGTSNGRIRILLTYENDDEDPFEEGGGENVEYSWPSGSDPNPLTISASGASLTASSFTYPALSGRALSGGGTDPNLSHRAMLLLGSRADGTSPLEYSIVLAIHTEPLRELPNEVDIPSWSTTLSNVT